MTRRTKKRFNNLMRCFAGKNGVSVERAKALSTEDKKFMCELIVNDRSTILSALIPDDPEFLSWLHSMGYLYTYTNVQGLQFLGTSVHTIKYAARNDSKIFTHSN